MPIKTRCVPIIARAYNYGVWFYYLSIPLKREHISAMSSSLFPQLISNY